MDDTPKRPGKKIAEWVNDGTPHGRWQFAEGFRPPRRRGGCLDSLAQFSVLLLLYLLAMLSLLRLR